LDPSVVQAPQELCEFLEEECGGVEGEILTREGLHHSVYGAESEEVVCLFQAADILFLIIYLARRERERFCILVSENPAGSSDLVLELNLIFCRFFVRSVRVRDQEIVDFLFDPSAAKGYANKVDEKIQQNLDTNYHEQYLLFVRPIFCSRRESKRFCVLVSQNPAGSSDLGLELNLIRSRIWVALRLTKFVFSRKFEKFEKSSTNKSAFTFLKT
jgi:hypothetical protein